LLGFSKEPVAQQIVIHCFYPFRVLYYPNWVRKSSRRVYVTRIRQRFKKELVQIINITVIPLIKIHLVKENNGNLDYLFSQVY
jgi:hypothetical protein